MSARDAELLNRMFRPRGIAVVGASDDPHAITSRYLGGLQRHGYGGGIHPVNPEHETVMGLRCYPSLRDVPGHCDTAVLALAPEQIEGALADCAERGLAGAIVYAGGFAETGPEGAARERRLVERARELGIRLVGPNSPGFINFIDRTTLTGTSVAFREQLGPAGRVGLVVQSAGVAGIVGERAMDGGIGLSFMLCSGNGADFDTAEAIEYLAADPHTDTIAVYQEGVADAERLVGAWRRAVEAGKPVVVYTPGSSGASVRAAAAHTGSLVGDDAVFDGVARQLGVIRAHDLDELLEVAAALPRAREPEGVVILTTSGGGAVLAADALGRAGMELPQLPAAVQAALAEELGQVAELAVFQNPVDMTSGFIGDPSTFRRSIEIVCRAADHDVVVLIITAQGPELARTLSELVVEAPESRSGELVVCWYAGAMSDPARSFLRSRGVTVFDTPRTLAASLVAAREWNRRPRELPAPWPRPSATPATPASAAELFASLERNGVAVAPNVLVGGSEELASATAAIPPPWVLKSASPTLGRKSDAGAVRLGIADAAELEEAFGAVSRAAPPPLLLQSMVAVGFELLLSVTYDPAFGLALVLGPGGRMVELHRRVAVRPPPLTGDVVRDLLAEVELTPLLDGFRDLPPLDPDELARLGNGLARAAGDLLAPGGILEVNPLVLRADGGGLVCVDARVE